MARPSPAIITLGEQRYFIKQTKVTLVSLLVQIVDRHQDEFIPLTAIHWDKPVFDGSDLQKVCHNYENADDVWDDTFLPLILLLLPQEFEIQVNIKNCLSIDNSKANLPGGPLVIEKSTGKVYKTSKLVRDTHYAFISAVEPDLDSRAGFNEISCSDEDELEIAIPSRLYYQRTDSQPLAGIRVAVKDTIALQGLRTGYGNRAWAQTHEPEQRTAPCVQRLIDAGAVVVGKTKSSEFAEGVDPTDWSEGICPYNPRGDKHQKPSSSSTGSASATAAYEWLDISFGTDTGGSIRHPAGVQGLFGQRPTQDSIDTTGILAATLLFNTVGIFARTTEMFTKVGRYLIEPASERNGGQAHRKYNLLYPTRAPELDSCDPYHKNRLRWFPHPEVDTLSYTVAEKKIEAVVSQMEAELNCKRIPFNLDQLWQATHPIDQPRSIDEATGFIYGVVTTASAWNTDIDQFIQSYARANEGINPRISKLVRDRFEYGRLCSDEKIESAIRATKAFSDWLLKELFGSWDQDATTLLIFPQSLGLPDYRDEAPDHTSLFKEYFSIYSFAYLCGCPDYTIPVGEVPFHSPVTNQVEYLPISISLVGRPGTDLELFDLIDFLHDKGVISDVKAGTRMYADSPLAARGH